MSSYEETLEMLKRDAREKKEREKIRKRTLLEKTRETLSPRLIAVLKVSDAFDTAAGRFVTRNVLHLSTLAARNYGLTPSRLHKDFGLRIGTATRLKLLAVEAQTSWVDFANKYSQDPTLISDIEFDAERVKSKGTKKRKRD